MNSNLVFSIWLGNVLMCNLFFFFYLNEYYDVFAWISLLFLQLSFIYYVAYFNIRMDEVLDKKREYEKLNQDSIVKFIEVEK